MTKKHAQKLPGTLTELVDWLGVRREQRKRLEAEERLGKERVLSLVIAEDGTVAESEIDGEEFVLRFYPQRRSYPDWERLAEALGIDVAQTKERFAKTTVTTVIETERL